jgi:RNA polymerase sigma-70 factor (ECF subfamily)
VSELWYGHGIVIGLVQWAVRRTAHCIAILSIKLRFASGKVLRCIVPLGLNCLAREGVASKGRTHATNRFAVRIFVPFSLNRLTGSRHCNTQEMPTGPRDAVERRIKRMQEVLWVTEAQAGNTDAFLQLMGRYERSLLYYLRRLVPEGDFALDLHQEVWIDVFRELPSLQVPEAFRVWIYRIAHNKASRFIRKELIQEEMSQTLSEVEPGATQKDSEVAFASEAVHAALEHLPPNQREVLVLHYLRDLSTDELAIILDCPVGTVKSRLYHARSALRRIIERKKL